MKRGKFIKTISPIIIGVLVAIVLKTFFVLNAVVPTGSMEPTIMKGDRLIGLKFSYIIDDPARGDIVTFYDPEGSNNIFVKRIIGLPGETVTIVSGKVYIDNNDTPLMEPYINLEDEPADNFGPYFVPENCYFVLGDNRNQSYDSRFWGNTNYVNRDNITSKIVFRYHPNAKKID